MTAQARRASPATTNPKTSRASGAARAPTARATNPKAAKAPKAKAELEVVPNPAPTETKDLAPTRLAPTAPAAAQNPAAKGAKAPKSTKETNPRRRRKGRKGRRKNPPKPNPISSAVGLLAIGAAALGVGYVGYRAYARKRSAKAIGGSAAASLLQEGVTLAAIPSIVADVQQPISLSSVSPPPGGYSLVPDLVVHAPGTMSNSTPLALRNSSFGSGPGGVPNDLMWTGRDLSGAEISGTAADGVSQAIGSLVVGVIPSVAQALYDRFVAMVGAGQDWEGQHDAMIATALKAVAPNVDWSKGLAPYVRGDAPSKLWSAAQAIGAVASQSLSNKTVLSGG